MCLEIPMGNEFFKGCVIVFPNLPTIFILDFGNLPNFDFISLVKEDISLE